MDMLIKLYGSTIGSNDPHRAPVSLEGVDIRKPIGPEHTTVVRWVEKQFGVGWASEVQVALANRPVSAWLATRNGELLGFACYDATALGFFGPIGVSEAARGQRLGAALLLACLRDMRTVGYGYAVVGSVGAPEFFRRVAGATEIPESTPGMYTGMVAR
jgi:GNAT superfamily N-acetyltransferase